MSLPVRLRPPARDEFDRAVEWYERIRTGFGHEFEAAVQAVLDEVAATPARYPFADGDVREAPVRGFPYCVYYRVRVGVLVVVAVYHQARDPAGWKGR